MMFAKLYAGSAAAFAAATFVLITAVNPPLPSTARCAGTAASAIAGLIGHSLAKGVLWPLSLAQNVIVHDMPAGRWLLNRYDPFPGACRPDDNGL